MAFNFSGAIFSMLSAWTFTRRQFYQEPIFFYYRLLSLLFILHSLHNLPYAICYSRYFPTIDNYVASIYLKSQTNFGQLLTTVTAFLLNLVLCLLTGLVLNIVSFAQYKLYLNKRKRQNQREKPLASDKRAAVKSLVRKVSKERAAEANMFFMILTLC